MDDITSFFGLLKVCLCWSDVVRFIMLLDLIPHIIPFLLEGFENSF